MQASGRALSRDCRSDSRHYLAAGQQARPAAARPQIAAMPVNESAGAIPEVLAWINACFRMKTHGRMGLAITSKNFAGPRMSDGSYRIEEAGESLDTPLTPRRSVRLSELPPIPTLDIELDSDRASGLSMMITPDSGGAIHNDCRSVVSRLNQDPVPGSASRKGWCCC
jgi:hypothetical protein